MTDNVNADGRADPLAELRAMATPRQVADYLSRLGCRGGFATYNCPLARFIRTRAKDPAPDGIVIETEYRAHGVWLKLPPACRRFVRRFDRLEYPELEER